MASLGCFLVCTFGNFLAPVLVATHTVNNLDLGNELENEGYESNLKKPYFDPHPASTGINKMNLFEKILGHILLYTLEYILGIQEKYNKRVRREPHSLEYIPDDYKTQEMCKKAVEADSCLLKFVPVHLRTHCFKVVKKRKAQKAKIKEELMRVAWHPSR